MIKRYEHGGRIGDETFNVGNLGKGNISGDSLRTLMSRKSKIRVSTKQPKWALNNGPMKTFNPNIYKSGGKLRKYQYGSKPLKSSNNLEVGGSESPKSMTNDEYLQHKRDSETSKYLIDNSHHYTPEQKSNYQERQKRLHEFSGNPTVKYQNSNNYSPNAEDRTRYNSNENTIYTDEDTNLSTEYTHSYQANKQYSKKEMESRKTDDINQYPIGNDEYENWGTIEHKAHKQIEPEMNRFQDGDYGPQGDTTLLDRKLKIVTDDQYSKTDNENLILNPHGESKIDADETFASKGLPITPTPLKTIGPAQVVDYGENEMKMRNNSINNPNLQNKPKPGQSTEMKKLGGKLKRYQVAGQTPITDLNNTMRGRGNAGYNPLTGKPNYKTFELNPNISYGNPKTWGQIYGGANITKTPVYNEKSFTAGYDKRNLGSLGLRYNDINGDKAFGATANYNRGPIKAVGTVDLNRNSNNVKIGGEYKNDNGLYGSANYNYTNNKTIPGNVIHGLSGAVGNDRFTVIGNTSFDKANPNNNATNISGIYNGPKGGYVKGGFYQGNQGNAGTVEGGYTGKNGNISGSATYGNGMNGLNAQGGYFDNFNMNKGNKLNVNLTGKMNLKGGGNTGYRQNQSTNAPEGGGYSSPTIPNSNYYATPQSTDTNLKQNNRVNAVALAKKRANEKAMQDQGTIKQTYSQPYYPQTQREANIQRINTINNIADKGAKLMHTTAQGTSDAVNFIKNGENPDINRYLDPKLDRPIAKVLGIKNPYIAPAINLGLDFGNYLPGKWLGHIEEGGNLLKTLGNVGKHVFEQGLVHPLTNPMHGPANYYSLGVKTKLNPNYDENAEYKEQYNKAYEDWNKYKDAEFTEYPKGQYYINKTYVTPQEYNNALKYRGVTDYKTVMPKHKLGGKIKRRIF